MKPKAKFSSPSAPAHASPPASPRGPGAGSPPRATRSGASGKAVAARLFNHEEIAARARRIWEAQGSPEGRDEENWFQAERELREEELKATEARRFADPDRLTDSRGDPADEVDRRLAELTAPAAQRGATSL
ncbi:MAG: DUF2934 domain-containing protein [Opitutaceae bacterium]